MYSSWSFQCVCVSNGQGSQLNFVSWEGQFPTIVFSDSDGAGRDLCGEPMLQLLGSRTGKGHSFLCIWAAEAQNALKSGDSPLAALDCNYFSMLWLRRGWFWFWAWRLQAGPSQQCRWKLWATGLHVMGCVFSLPEDRRDAAQRLVKCLQGNKTLFFKRCLCGIAWNWLYYWSWSLNVSDLSVVFACSSRSSCHHGYLF